MKTLASVVSVLALMAELSPAAGSETTCGPIAEVPEIHAAFRDAEQPEVWFRRSQDLLRLFSQGDGVLETHRRPDRFDLTEGAALYPLPWQAATERRDRLRLLTWQDRSRGNDENMPAIVLRADESWCSSELEWTPGSRLRFEAFSLEPGRRATLRVTTEGREELFSEALSFPRSLSAETQASRALAGNRGRVCFRASGAAAAVGEPRIVSPEKPGEDERPRWLVLTIMDALRGDLLRDERAGRILPALDRLSRSGRHFDNAVAPGCHTRASVWPILMGRDLMRIDPLKRRQSMPIQSPLDSVYSRANLFVSHLAEAAGYHAILLGNNAYMRVIPAFSRYSSWGRTDSGTVDTVERLPDLFARYADERVLLVYYVSAPHGQSHAPRRLFDALSCAKLEGVEQCRCSYEARARHGDEALEALQRGLEAHGLAGEAFQIVTADHGELLGDGMKVEGEVPTFATGIRRGAFQSFDLGHGSACHFRETDVPLVIHGKGVEPGRWAHPVSGLDVVPTLLQVMELAPVGKLDGRPLPLSSSARPRSRRLVSYGFCSDSAIEDDQQLIWWVQGCRLRTLDEGKPLEHRAELWSEGRRVATDASDPERLHRLMLQHENWIRERLAADAFVFSAADLETAEMEIVVEGGRVVDYGPSSTVYGLEGIAAARLSEEADRLSIRFEGYRGLFHVSTLPPRAPLRVHVEGKPDLLTFVGPFQLPLRTAGKLIDPETRPGFLVADAVPERRVASRPALRFWWQRHGGGDTHETMKALSDFDRVLREWGYIR